MKADYVITNEKLFDEEVNEVRTDGLKSDTFRGNTTFHGTISIVTWNNEERTFTGQHGPEDYKEYYGFVLVPKE